MDIDHGLLKIYSMILNNDYWLRFPIWWRWAIQTFLQMSNGSVHLFTDIYMISLYFDLRPSNEL